MVVAQLVERSLPTPVICGLNPDIGKILSTHCTIEKTKLKKKGWEWPIFKKIDFASSRYQYRSSSSRFLVSSRFTHHEKGKDRFEMPEQLQKPLDSGNSFFNCEWPLRSVLSQLSTWQLSTWQLSTWQLFAMPGSNNEEHFQDWFRSEVPTKQERLRDSSRNVAWFLSNLHLNNLLLKREKN